MNVYSILDSFARGVNHYIAAHRSEIPAWIDAITPEDIEALERSQYMRFYSVDDALAEDDRAGAASLPISVRISGPSRRSNPPTATLFMSSTPYAVGQPISKIRSPLITPGKLMRPA